MKNKAFEVNFDGIVGPTHNYSGLSYGNIASAKHQFSISNPRDAALQGLEKMKYLADLGIKQAVLPPQIRPHMPTLHSLGYRGSDREVLEAVSKEDPDLLLAVSSAAAMWTANAATVSPSADTADHKVHLTSANLSSKFHRSIEAQTTSKALKAIFRDEKFFVHHDPLPAGAYFADEGAANHTRLCSNYGNPGVELFVYGRRAFQPNTALPKHFPARQTLEASQAIARLHRLDPASTIFTQQHPTAIDAGAFHNDVVAVGNENVLLFHGQAFLNKETLLREIEDKTHALGKFQMIFIEVEDREISLHDAVASYLFNSQLITLPNGKMVLVAPTECLQKEHIKNYIDMLIQSPTNPISNAAYLNLRQSMQNGGGPACLRLRVALNQKEFDAINQAVVLDDALYISLKAWINKHYRDKLDPKDLADPMLLEENYRSLDELTKLLHLGPIYHFQ